ncbi:hypothetical protein Q8309_001390 [Salmonella enterica]|nr:hypothetical protein [Salmonella enterica]
MRQEAPCKPSSVTRQAIALLQPEKLTESDTRSLRGYSDVWLLIAVLCTVGLSQKSQPVLPLVVLRRSLLPISLCCYTSRPTGSLPSWIAWKTEHYRERSELEAQPGVGYKNSICL